MFDWIDGYFKWVTSGGFRRLALGLILPILVLAILVVGALAGEEPARDSAESNSNNDAARGSAQTFSPEAALACEDVDEDLKSECADFVAELQDRVAQDGQQFALCSDEGGRRLLARPIDVDDTAQCPDDHTPWL